MTRFLLCLLFHYAMSVAFAAHKPVLIVTTDIGQDPDDQQSLVRLLHYSDMFLLAGIIANADANYSHEPPVIRDSIVHRLIDAYGLIHNNLIIHSSGFPSAHSLHALVKRGCAGNGNLIPVEHYIGEGKDTEGSEWIIHVVDQSESEPVNVSVWGGACDLAQALWKVSFTRNGEDVRRFVSKLRVYFIGKQDSSNDWILENYPGLWAILSHAQSGNSWESAYRGMFLGGELELTSGDWIQTNLDRQNELCSLYPVNAYTGGPDRNPFGALKEGDSPAFLYFIQNGLNIPERPDWGGWGGRYVRHECPFYRDVPDSVYDESKSAFVYSAPGTIFRWRRDFQCDFAARAKWGSANQYDKANHHPVICLDRSAENGYIKLKAKAGETVDLDASASHDPDCDSLCFEWFFYPEAGNFPAIREVSIGGDSSPRPRIVLPVNASGKTIQLILKLTDVNPFPLVSYKRILIEIL